MSTQTFTVADTIFAQLGGSKFRVMTGATFTPIKNGLAFTIGKNVSKANRVEITLNALDLYDVKFIKHTPFSVKVTDTGVKVREEKTVVLKEYNDIYCDMLQDVFTRFTGLYTHL